MNPNDRLELIQGQVSSLHDWVEQTRIARAREQQRLAGIKYVEWFPQIQVPATTFTVQTGAGAVDQGYWLDLRVLAFKLSANDSVACYKGENATGRLFAYGGPPGASATTTVTTATGTGTITAGAGSATLPAGDSVTGFTLSFSAAPSTTGTAVLSNVAGGSLTFDIPTGQTSPFTVTFPTPIPASSGAAVPTLTIAGLGTGAGAIVLYGTSTSTVAAPTQNLVTIDLSKDVLWKGEPLFFTTSGTGNITSVYLTGWQVPAEEQGKLY